MPRKRPEADEFKKIMESVDGFMEGRTGYGTFNGEDILEFLQHYHRLREVFLRQDLKENLERLDFLLMCTMKYMTDNTNT